MAPPVTAWETSPHAAPVQIFDALDSTNAEARRRAESGETGPVWIVARRQTSGRGRRGRAWSTEAGNLAATLLMTMDRSPAEAAELAFVAALAAADTLDAWVPPSLVSIKWPNDVLLDREKVSGILIESGTRPDGLLWVAIGCGMNLTHRPKRLDQASTRVADHLRVEVISAPTAEQAADILAARFAARFAAWTATGFAPIAKAWSARAAGLGEACVARLSSETLEGVAEGLEPNGALRLRLADGTVRRITAGDVFLGPR